MAEGRVKHAKYEGRNPAPTKAKQKEQNLDARLAKAGRTRTPGHSAKSEQNKLQQKLARNEVDRSDDKRSGKKRPKSRSSNKRYQNQK